ncbi:unnamed protein product [Mytilus edulis]|uniref:Adhesion G-protein coupled receptor D1-like n=1 Tax=Mytilus edulis TaxID=6550 RepID=A0A8S3QXH1_MYTED|nr:unnamed protein product [Mytilus edulis]
MITWKHIDNQQIEITYILSYRRDYNNAHECELYHLFNTEVTFGGGGKLACFKGCQNDSLADKSYYCTQFSVEDNWTYGQRAVNVTLPTTPDNIYQFQYSSAAWISLIGGGSVWSLLSTVNLSKRQDTGRINSSPSSSLPPFIQIKQGCFYSLIIPVEDADNDIIRCRWAIGDDECGDICNSLVNSELNKGTCVISYNATGELGLYAVALQIEDFATEQSDNPLSSVPLHQASEKKCITVYVTNSTNLCSENVDKFNTTWSITPEKTLTTVACTGEYTGNASKILHKSIQHLRTLTAKLLSGDSADILVSTILEELENVTKENNGLRSGDLLTSSYVLNDVAKYVAENKDKLTFDQLQIFGSLCDNLLDDSNHQSWEELNNEGSGGVTSLVNAVTEYNDAFNDVIDGKFSIIVEKENVGLTGYSSAFYRNISRLFPEYLLLNGKLQSFNGSYDVNSIIADFTIHGRSCSNFSLIIKFDHILGDYSRPFCGFWDFSAPNTVNGAWSSFGSRVVDATDSYTICEYNHTTNFAILMSPGKTPLSHQLPLSMISVIGCGVSILFLVITVVVHFVLWDYVANDRTKTLMNLCVALILSYVIFLAGITRTDNKVVCSVIAVALHYMFLTDFALMLAEGIHIVRMVVIIFPTRSIVYKLIPACWIVPAGIVGISASSTKLEGYGNQQFCWLTLESNLIWAFIGPALLVIMINFIIIILTVHKMMTTRGLAAKSLKEKSKIGLKSICVILPLFGVTWVLGAFSVNDDLVIFQYLFAIFNSLQGLFICVFHCFLNIQVKQGYRKYQKRRNANRMNSKLSTDSSNYDSNKRNNGSTIITEERNE